MGSLNEEDVWLSIKKDLKNAASPILFNTYINKGAYIKKIDEINHLIDITAPTDHHRNNIEERLYGVLKEIVTKQLGPQYRLMFSVTKREPAQLSIDDFGPLFEEKKEVENNLEQRKREAGLNSLYTFDRLVVGNHNRLAYAVAT